MTRVLLFVMFVLSMFLMYGCEWGEHEGRHWDRDRDHHGEWKEERHEEHEEHEH